MTPPTAEGGALRSQDLRTTGDPTVARRRDPARRTRTPARPCPTTRTPAAPIANARRIIAYGLRNPFRITIRPGTNEIWVGDVGWNTWEEINRVAEPDRAGRELRLAVLRGRRAAGGVRQRQPEPLREPLRGRAPERSPRRFYTYNHAAKVVAGEACPTGGSSITGLAFYDGGTFPAPYDGALFFADYSRTASGDVPGRQRPARTRRRFRRSQRRAPARWTSRSAPAATSSTSTSTAARSAGSTHSPSNHAADRGCAGSADQRAAAADR